MSGEGKLLQRVETVRQFSRFYTRQIGLLQEGLLDSPFSLAEARVIYELAHREPTTATELCRGLTLDPGYMSRLLAALQRRKLLARRRSAEDGRETLLSLTEQGRKAFARLNAASRNDIEAMLAPLSVRDQQRLVAAMQSIERLLGAEPERRAPYLLRPPQPGDMGWVVQRHGLLYAQEYGWDESFEALVAEIVAQFSREHDPRRERCWIAERNGENVGSIFLVRHTDTIGKLRLLLVEPSARGLGLGQRLVAECIRTAREVGYRKLRLWTNDVLLSARRIYERAGFRLIEEEKHHSFGHDLVGQIWELVL